MEMSSYRNYLYVVFLGALMTLFYFLDLATRQFPPSKKTVTSGKTAVQQRPVEKAEPVASIPKETTPVVTTNSENDSNAIETFENKLNVYAERILKDLPKGEKRDDVIIRYYPHSSDKQLVESLENLGFYVHRRPTDSLSYDQKSNSLFYGDNVQLLDIQLVAHTLIKQGVNLRQMKPSRYHDDWKKNSIEIGAVLEARNLPVISAETIAKFQK